MPDDSFDELEELKRTVAALAARVEHLESEAKNKSGQASRLPIAAADIKDVILTQPDAPAESVAAMVAEPVASGGNLGGERFRNQSAAEVVLVEGTSTPDLPARIVSATDGSGEHIGGHDGDISSDASSSANSSGKDASSAGAEQAGAAAASGEVTVPNRGSLESRIGQVWLSRIGIASLVIGLALLLMYSFQYFGAQAKLACGLIISAALIALGEWTGRRKSTTWFGSGLIGGGWALAYFTAYASHFVHSVQVVGDATTASMLMLATALGALTHAVMRKAQEIANLSIVLGYITVALTDPAQVSLVANLGLLVSSCLLAINMKWHRLLMYSTLASYLVLIPHFQNFSATTAYGFSESVLAIVLLFVYWLAYLVCGLFAERRSEGKSPMLVTGGLINALCFTFGYFAAMEYLKQAGFGEQVDTYRFPVTIAVAGIYSAASYACGRLRRQGLSTLYLLLSVFMATISVLLKFDTQTQTGALYSVWAMEAGLLAWLGLNYGMPALRRFAFALACLVNLVTVCAMISVTWRTTWTGETAFGALIQPLIAIASAIMVDWCYRSRLKQLPVSATVFQPETEGVAVADAGAGEPMATAPAAAPEPPTAKVMLQSERVMLMFGFQSYFAAASVLCWFLPVMLVALIKEHLLPNLLPSFLVGADVNQLYVLWWALESAVIVALGIRMGSRGTRVLGALGFLSTIIAAMFIQPGVVAMIMVAAMLFAIARLYKKYVTLPVAADGKPRMQLYRLWALAAVFVLTIMVPGSLPAHMLAPYWAVEGLALLVAGFRLGEKPLRVCGLLAFVMLIGKLLFVDLAAADTLQRIISFIVAGVVLLVSSYGYARFAKLLEPSETQGRA